MYQSASFSPAFSSIHKETEARRYRDEIYSDVPL